MAAFSAWQAYSAVSALRWYAGLLKPTFTPSTAVVVTSFLLLALTLAWSLARLLRSPDYLPDRPIAIRLVVLGLALDAAWSWVFFAGRHPTVALAAAGALALTAAASAWKASAVDGRAGLLLVPWTLGAGFAFVFDLSIALKNG